jgi:hypothetical protein
VEVKALYVPSKVPNKVVAEFLGNHGKVETITSEMTTEHGFPTIETGTRVAKMTDIKTDISRKSRIGGPNRNRKLHDQGVKTSRIARARTSQANQKPTNLI